MTISIPLSVISFLSGLAFLNSEYSFAGLIFANKPSSFLRARSALSGLILPGKVSHLGPPTAPSSTLSESKQVFNASSVNGIPYLSMLIPPASTKS